MKQQINSDLPPKLKGARRTFEQGRSHQKKRPRLPDHLWSLAGTLARQYGSSKTAKALRLEYNALKARSQKSVVGILENSGFLDPNHCCESSIRKTQE